MMSRLPEQLYRETRDRSTNLGLNAAGFLSAVLLCVQPLSLTDVAFSAAPGLMGALSWGVYVAGCAGKTLAAAWLGAKVLCREDKAGIRDDLLTMAGMLLWILFWRGMAMAILAPLHGISIGGYRKAELMGALLWDNLFGLRLFFFEMVEWLWGILLLAPLLKGAFFSPGSGNGMRRCMWALLAALGLSCFLRRDWGTLCALIPSLAAWNDPVSLTQWMPLNADAGRMLLAFLTGGCLYRGRERLRRVPSWSLWGAGIGCVGVSVVLWWLCCKAGRETPLGDSAYDISCIAAGLVALELCLRLPVREGRLPKALGKWLSLDANPFMIYLWMNILAFAIEPIWSSWTPGGAADIAKALLLGSVFWLLSVWGGKLPWAGFLLGGQRRGK